MTTIHPPAVDQQRTLGDLVAERPARARVLEAAGLDYCCHGNRSLAAAAAEAGLDAEALASGLAAVADTADAAVDAMAPAELADHIESTHHGYLHEELPLLDALAAKVATVHGERHPELAEVSRLVSALRGDLEPHLAKEEVVVFPAAHEGAPSEPVTTVLAELRAEHEVAGELLGELRRTTRGYEVPADGCASYRSLYERLPALEADTFRHIHLENNVLFPAMEAAGPSCDVP